MQLLVLSIDISSYFICAKFHTTNAFKLNEFKLLGNLHIERNLSTINKLQNDSQWHVQYNRSIKYQSGLAGSMFSNDSCTIRGKR